MIAARTRCESQDKGWEISRKGNSKAQLSPGNIFWAVKRRRLAAKGGRVLLRVALAFIVGAGASGCVSPWNRIHNVEISNDDQVLDLAVTSCAADQLDLFVVRNDHTLYQRTWKAASGWNISTTPLGPGLQCSAVAAVSWDAERIDLFALCGPSPVSLKHRVCLHNNWGQWKDVDTAAGLGLTSIAACSGKPNRIDIAGISFLSNGISNGTINSGLANPSVSYVLYHFVGSGDDSPGSWTSPEDLGGSSNKKVAAASPRNSDWVRVVVVAEGSRIHEKLWQSLMSPPTSWAQWSSLKRTYSLVGACFDNGGVGHIFGVDSGAHELIHIGFPAALGSGFETNLGGGHWKTSLAVASRGDNIDVFGVGEEDGKIKVMSSGPDPRP